MSDDLSPTNELAPGITIQSVHAVHEGDGERTCGHPRWFFTRRDAAEQARTGRGYFGGLATVTTARVLVISASLVDPNAAANAKPLVFQLASETPVELNVGPEDESAIVTQALAKLTDYEKRLLGLA